MSNGQDLPDCEAAIDRRVEAAVRAGGPSVDLAREVIEGYTDRWYGRLVVRTAQAVAADVDPACLVPAATAIELLRGYCRIRSELLVQVGDDAAHSLSRDPSEALLAGDFLHSAALSTLEGGPEVTAAVDVLTDVSQEIVEAFAATGAPTDAGPEVLDATAGALGEGGAVLGAVLAGADSARVDRWGTVGRGLGVARQVQCRLDADGRNRSVVLPASDRRRLRERAAERLAGAVEARRRLDTGADTRRLNPLFEAVAGLDS